MRCYNCHGIGYFEYFFTCPECQGSGITSCCDTAGSNVGEVSMKKVGDYVNENVRSSGSFISATDPYVFAHNADAYLIWHRETGKIVWVGEEGKLGEDGYSVAWDKALELNLDDSSSDVEHTIIACTIVRDIPPGIPSRIESCTKCKHSVWVAHSTPIPKNAIYMCMECIDWSKVTKIEKPTVEQMNDILTSN